MKGQVKDQVSQLFKRILELVKKLLSVKGVIFMMATYLFAIGRLTPEYWFIIALLFVSSRELYKYLGMKQNPSNFDQGLPRN